MARLSIPASAIDQLERPSRASLSRGAGDRIFAGTLSLSALLVPAIMLLFLAVLVRGAWPAITGLGMSFFKTADWDPSDGSETYGALSFVYGTIVTSVLGLILAAPVGIGVAVFLNELFWSKAKGTLTFMIETLATIPSVVYGMWGLFVLKPFVTTFVQPALAPMQPTLDRVFGTHLPLFKGPPIGIGMLTGTLILAVMVLPIIVALTLDAIRAVPNSYREAALALGSTRWEMIRTAVLPAARSGILGACILALGRALGETMAITMVIGNTAQIKLSLFEPADTISSVIANQYGEASGVQFAALTELALILLVVTLIVNLAARLIVRRWSHTRAVHG